MKTQQIRMIKRMILIGAICLALISTNWLDHRMTSASSSSAPEQAGKYQMSFPRGIPADLWELLVPDDNPMTEAKVALGQDLYFDKRLSVDNTVSCATCHDPKLAFTDGKPVAEGVGGKKGARNSPTILNATFNVEQFWDGRAKSLEDQAKQPLINPVEMAMPSHDAVVAKVKQMPEYVKRFQDVFGGPVTIDAIAKAIATRTRRVISPRCANRE